MSETELKTILEKHRAWVNSNGKKGVRAELKNMDLSGFDFSDANLWSADFRNSNLTGANFSGGNFIGAYFQDAILVDTDFTKANCTGAIFRKADLTRTKIYEAIFCKANFWGSNLTDAQFYGSDLSEAIFEYAKIYNVSFIAVSFRRAKLLKADLRNGDFKDSQVKYIMVDRETADAFPFEIQQAFRHTWDIRDEDGRPINSFLVIRSMDLPREYHHLALLLLTNLGNAIQERHKGKIYKVKIEEEDVRITLIVETNPQDASSVEHSMEKYIQVSNGNAPISDFTQDPEQIRHIQAGIRLVADFQRELTHRLEGYQDALGPLLDAFQTHLDSNHTATKFTQYFETKYKIQIKPGPKRAGVLEINDKIVRLSSIECDICLALARQLKDDWKFLLGEEIRDPLEVGWVSYDDLENSVGQWIDSQSKGNPVAHTVIINAIHRLNGKIRKALDEENDLSFKDLLENGDKFGHSGHYRWKIWPRYVEISG